jgi:predicted transcriptional regulator
MAEEILTVRIAAEQRAALERLAKALGHDLDAVVAAAIEAHLERHLAEVEHIARGLAEAESGAPGVGHDEVFRRLRARIEKHLVSSG